MARKKRARYKEPDVEKETVEVECAFCQGRGRDPFGILSPLSNCSVCKGKGVVMGRVFSLLLGLPVLPAVAEA